MKPDEPQNEDTLLDRYRRASAAEALRPGDATRGAILAEARRVADEQSRPDAFKPFDTRHEAADRGRFRFAAFGTLGAAVFAALLAVPLYLRAPSPGAAAPRDLPRANAPSARESIPAFPAADATRRESLPDPPSPAPAAPAVARARAPASSAARARAVEPAAPPSVPGKSADLRGDLPAAQSRGYDVARAGAAQELQDVTVTAQPSQPVAAAMPRHASNAQMRALRATPAPLLQAVTDGDVAQVTWLLDQGASLRESDDAGRSALFLAVIQRRADLVSVLLNRGANPSAADRAGQTPLDWARQHHCDDMVQLLTPPATH